LLLQGYTGRKVNVKILSDQEAIEYHKAHNSLPPSQHWVFESWATWFRAMDQGEVNTVDPIMEKLLGRKPRGIQEMMDELFIPNQAMETTDFDYYAK
jgi:hypothetical protein